MCRIAGSNGVSSFTFTGFNQVEVVRQNALGQEHEGGICKGLSVEWLRVGGSVGAMRQDNAQDMARCARDTAYEGVRAILNSRGLSEVVFKDEMDSPQLLDFVCLNVGKYFIGMYAAGSRGGHAIAAITDAQGGRWFDPNTGETNFPTSRLNYVRSLRHLLELYSQRYSRYFSYRVEACPPFARLKIRHAES